MGKEIERKFLVNGDDWRNTRAVAYRQGYLSTEKGRTVRVRIAAGRATLTIKGETRSATRTEYEYEIPTADACEILDNLCTRPLIEKRRHRVEFGGLTWEVDEFLGENAGLILAEVELASEDQSIKYPPWLGTEVTDDPRYFNANLVERPYRDWCD